MDMKRAMTTNRQGGSVIPKEGARELGTKSTSFNPHLSVLALSISSLEFFPVLPVEGVTHRITSFQYLAYSFYTMYPNLYLPVQPV